MSQTRTIETNEGLKGKRMVKTSKVWTQYTILRQMNGLNQATTPKEAVMKKSSHSCKSWAAYSFSAAAAVIINRKKAREKRIE